MKTLPLAAFASTLLAASLPLISPVQAGTGVQRCQSAEGTTVYTDKPCSMLGAAPRPLPGDLLTRIARDEARTASSPELAAVAEPGTLTVARRSPAAGCARSPTQLAMDLRGSIALGDVNRLAESYHWVGMSQKQAQPIMARLARMASTPMVETQYFDARIGPGGLQLTDAGAGNPASGVMQLRLGGRSIQVIDFEVIRYAGCYFIRN